VIDRRAAAAWTAGAETSLPREALASTLRYAISLKLRRN